MMNLLKNIVGLLVLLKITFPMQIIQLTRGDSMLSNKDYALKIVSKKLSISNNKDDLNIACILDTFSYECFRHEASFFQLGTNNWEGLILEKKPKFLFVESAWQGYNYQWINKITNIDISKDDSLVSLQ